MRRVDHGELAGRFAHVSVLESVERFQVGDRSIVVNPTLRPVSVLAPGTNILPPLSSRTLQSVEIEEADLLVVITAVEPTQFADVKSGIGWQHHSELTSGARPSGPSSIPLWRSPQVPIGSVNVAPDDLPGSHVSRQAWPFQVRLSLWYAEAGTDCGIHNAHGFMEIHTQVAGVGRMQKFLRNDGATLFEDELMTPGYTTSVPYCRVIDRHTFEYPWHRYLADTACLWLALEYCPSAG